MEGEIAALFYRYKTNGGFEYVADLLIGPRAAQAPGQRVDAVRTHPGDSGTLWLLEPVGRGSDAKVRRPTSKAH